MKFECIKTYTTDFHFTESMLSADNAQQAIHDPPPNLRPLRVAQDQLIKTSGDVAHLRARERMREHGGSYLDNLHAILDADPKLKAAYSSGEVLED